MDLNNNMSVCATREQMASLNDSARNIHDILALHNKDGYYACTRLCVFVILFECVFFFECVCAFCESVACVCVHAFINIYNAYEG